MSGRSPSRACVCDDQWSRARSVLFRKRGLVGCGGRQNELEQGPVLAVRRRSKLAAMLLDDHGEIASPNPIPRDFVVTNASNILSRFFGSIPGPESRTERTIASPLRCTVFTRNTRFRSVVSSIASIALRTQLPCVAVDKRYSRRQL